MSNLQRIAPILLQPKAINFEDTSVAFANKSNFLLRKTYLIFAAMNRQWLVKLGTFFIKLAIRLHLPVKSLIKNTIFGHFCGGENIADCQKTIATLGQAHIGTILDYSVEGEDDEASFDATTREILLTIEKASSSDSIPFCVFKVTGLGNTELLENIQNGESLDDEDRLAFSRIEQRVDTLCKKAHDLGVRIFIDAEESWIQNTIDGLAYEMMKRYNKQQPIVFNTYQLYLKDTLCRLVQDSDTAAAKGYFLGAKLVRGAYMEKERARAHELEYCEPVHNTKEDTDRDFNKAVEFCVRNIKTVSICVGTHNEYSCKHLACQMQKVGLAPNDPHIYFAQLLGMSDNISYSLSKEGYNVAKYVPYGPVTAVMPYLIRRAEENTSVAGQASREFTLIKNEMKRRGRA